MAKPDTNRVTPIRREVLQNAVGEAVNGDTFAAEGLAVVGLQVVISASATVTFEGSIDGSNWVAVDAVNKNSGASGSTAAASGIYIINTSGLRYLRARISTFGSGTITVTALGEEGGTDDTGLTSSGGLVTITDGTTTVTTAGTAVVIAASETIVKWVTFQAPPANTGFIAIGASTVVAADGSERGSILSALMSVKFENVDLNTIYADTTVNGEKVVWTHAT